MKSEYNKYWKALIHVFKRYMQSDIQVPYKATAN